MMSPFNFLQKILFSKRQVISTEAITILFRQLATLISSGVSLIHAFELLEKSQDNNSLRILIFSLKQSIVAGKHFSTSLKQYPYYFSNLTQQLICIGEATGKLDYALLTIADHREKNLRLKQRIQQTLFYPCVLLSISMLITIGMFIFVIPTFADLFKDMHTTLPLLTLCIFMLADGCKQFCYLLLFPILLTAFLLSSHPSAAKWRKKCMDFLLQLPIIHRYAHKISMIYFARNLALTFNAGLPLTQGLKLTMTAQQTLFPVVINTLIREVSAGIQLHQAMLSTNYFPLLMVQMIKIGEESGMLAEMLNKVADIVETDFDQFIARLSVLLEPLIMVVLGALIGGLVIGMYLPIFKLGNTL